MTITKPIDPIPGRPLDMHDILMECVNYEDRVRALAERKESPVMPSFKDLPKLQLTAAAAHVFGRGIFSKTLSILLP